MKNEKENLNEIVRELKMNESIPRTEHISSARLKQLMANDDIEVLGVIYAFISDPQRSGVIKPPLSFHDSFQFMTRYYERCFREDPNSKWADSRFSAGHDLVNWFTKLWNDKHVPRSALADLRTWLAVLYREGDAALRNCIVTATLEHLLEQKKIRKYFADWESDPILTTAYSEAMEWRQRGGTSPLGQPGSVRKAKADRSS